MAAITPGQISIFDLHENPQKLKPYEYSWERWVGRRVTISGVYVPGMRKYQRLHGVIHSFDHYYTIVNVCGKLYAGTTYNVNPEE